MIFYGGGPSPSAASKVRFPLLGHYAEHDAPVTPRVPEIAAALRDAGQSFTHFVYPGTEHGFFNETRPVYAPGAAELAWLRTTEFLKHHLRSGSRVRTPVGVPGSAKAQP